MAVKKTSFICGECGHKSSKWLGRCPDCGEWNSFEEEFLSEKGAIFGVTAKQVTATPLTMTTVEEELRFATGITELDRVLGGGLVQGAVVLIGGEPGIGKSTILLHLLANIAETEGRVLYVSGEESPKQILLRANRLGITEEKLYLATETEVGNIGRLTNDLDPVILAIDSIQTMTCDGVNSAPGSVTQIREATSRLIEYAKVKNVPVILVGHVTKEGGLAGPKILEHMVDCVLYFEGERTHNLRILRTMKNRFGSTNEIGVFRMQDNGMTEVENPSEIFLAERPLNVPGSVVVPTVEGLRPILVEVQALVSPTNLGTARRTAIGADHNRLGLLCAVLEKKAGLDLYGHDIFLNVTGGLRVDEPALDLGIICAIASSILEKIILSDSVVFGEVGLAGEIRNVGNAQARVKEAERLGFSRCIMPKVKGASEIRADEIKIVRVESVRNLLEVIFND